VFALNYPLPRIAIASSDGSVIAAERIIAADRGRPPGLPRFSAAPGGPSC
jgi:hypothetical protein